MTPYSVVLPGIPSDGEEVAITADSALTVSPLHVNTDAAGHVLASGVNARSSRATLADGGSVALPTGCGLDVIADDANGQMATVPAWVGGGRPSRARPVANPFFQTPGSRPR